MVYQDKQLQCLDCGSTFTFSAEEQEFYAGKGFTNEPKRCPTCRNARKANRQQSGGNRYGTLRQMYPAVCAECGRETEVPFQPRGDRPVYCRDCYNKVTPGRY